MEEREIYKYGGKNVENLIKRIIQCVYNVRGCLGPGYLESVYRKALLCELKLSGLNVSSEVPLKVYYRETCVGEFFADMIVEDCVVIELKAIENLHAMHEVQLVNYLTITGVDDGLLINFGAEHIQIKRKYRQYNKKT